MEYAVFGFIILGGIIIAWQGVQAMQGKRRVKMKMIERMLVQSLGSNEQVQTMKILGGLRFVYGLVFIGIGIYFLATVLLR